MKIEIDTNEDSYEIWKKAQELIEYTYQSTPKQILSVKRDFVSLKGVIDE